MLFAVVSLIGGMAASLGFSLQARHFAALAKARARDSAAAAIEASRVAADSRTVSALASAESGEIDRGVYGLVEALEPHPDVTAEDRVRRLALRRNITAWMARAAGPRHVIGGIRPAGPASSSPARIVQWPASSTATGCGGSTWRPVRPSADPDGREFPPRSSTRRPIGRWSLTAAKRPGRSPTTWDVRVFDADSGRPRAQLPPLEGEAVGSEVVFDPNGRYIGLNLARRGIGLTFRMVWRLDTATRSACPATPSIAGERTEFRMIAVRGGRTVLAYPEKLPPYNFSERLVFWDLDAGSRRSPDRAGGRRSSRDCGDSEGRYSDCEFDGTCLVYVLDTGLVRWWDVATGPAGSARLRARNARPPATLARGRPDHGRPLR